MCAATATQRVCGRPPRAAPEAKGDPHLDSQTLNGASDGQQHQHSNDADTVSTVRKEQNRFGDGAELCGFTAGPLPPPGASGGSPSQPSRNHHGGDAAVPRAGLVVHAQPPVSSAGSGVQGVRPLAAHCPPTLRPTPLALTGGATCLLHWFECV